MKTSRKTLERKWKQVYGSDLPKFIHKAYASKYLAWQKANGDFDKTTLKQIEKLVLGFEQGNAINPIVAKLEIKTGTKLIREFRGKTYEVIKSENGYRYQDQEYRSLSAIANEITGTRWNGKKFFGLV